MQLWLGHVSRKGRLSGSDCELGEEGEGGGVCEWGGGGWGGGGGGGGGLY